MSTYTENNRYTIQGKVLGIPFTHSVYSEPEDDEEDIVYESTYLYHEGNYSCDCNKIELAGLLREDEQGACGDTIKYEELWLVRENGKRVDLLKEGWFKE